MPGNVRRADVSTVSAMRASAAVDHNVTDLRRGAHSLETRNMTSWHRRSLPGFQIASFPRSAAAPISGLER